MPPDAAFPPRGKLPSNLLLNGHGKAHAAAAEAEPLLAVFVVCAAFLHTAVNGRFVASSHSADFFDPLVFFLLEAVAALALVAGVEACRRCLRLARVPELRLRRDAIFLAAPCGWWLAATVLVRSTGLTWAETATWTVLRGLVPPAVVLLGAAVNGEVPSSRGAAGAAALAAALCLTWRPSFLIWRAEEVAPDALASLFAALHIVFCRKALARCNAWTLHAHQTLIAAAVVGGVRLLAQRCRYTWYVPIWEHGHTDPGGSLSVLFLAVCASAAIGTALNLASLSLVARRGALLSAALSAWRCGMRGALSEIVGVGEEAAVEMADLLRAAGVSVGLACVWRSAPVPLVPLGLPSAAVNGLSPPAHARVRLVSHVRNKSDELTADDRDFLPERASLVAPPPPPKKKFLRPPYLEPVGRAPLAALRRLRAAVRSDWAEDPWGPWQLSPRGERRLWACHAVFWAAVFLVFAALILLCCSGALVVEHPPAPVDPSALATPSYLAAAPSAHCDGCERDPSLSPSADPSRPRAVITFMLKPERLSEFLAQALPRLDAFFNRRFRYPLLVFEHGLSAADKAAIRAASAGHVSFYDLRFEVPPGQEDVKMEESCSRLWGMGYRHMCRFHAISAHKIVAALGYEWYWRLDTDARLHAPVARDPFVAAREAGLRYAFAEYDWDTADCVVGFWNVTRGFLDGLARDERLAGAAGAAGAPLRLPAGMLAPDGEWNRVIVYNNLEVARADFFAGPLDDAYFAHVDASQGILQWRWGDAGMHTLAAFLFHPWDQIGRLDFVQYNHHRRRAPRGSARATELFSFSSW